MNKSRNRKMIIVLIAMIIMLLIVALYMVYFQLFKRRLYANHVYNARNWVDENKILRGTIRDRDGNILTYTQRDQDGNSYRINNYNYMYSSIIGYNSDQYGKSGIEQRFNRELLDIPIDVDFLTKLEDIYKKNDRGKDVFLTIDTQIQSYMYDLLGGYRGAIVVIDPSNGDILSMVSKPTFNVNSIDDDWNMLINSEDSLLLNRASQGLYTPGSTFKVISAISLLNKGVDLDYVDKGSTSIDGYKISNLFGREFGEISLREALIYSSNTYFSDKSLLLDNADFLRVTDSFYLGKDYDFDLPRSLAKIPFNRNLNSLDKAVTAFGQGKTLVTPMDMASVAAAIANKGELMKPRLVYKTLKDDKAFEIPPIKLSTAVADDINDKMVEYLTDTASQNGMSLWDGTRIAGKSGTAETVNTTNLWYIGFGPSESPRYAMAIILEDTGIEYGHAASELFRQAMQFLINR
ncbi:MAG: penicillin-binding transpeptidase domain-containing protein [Tissierellia bacterium]|nr:penicillin-binding transpeptidase domain-containing protein [Tissierellia bacterium]